MRDRGGVSFNKMRTVVSLRSHAVFPSMVHATVGVCGLTRKESLARMKTQMKVEESLCDLGSKSQRLLPLSASEVHVKIIVELNYPFKRSTECQWRFFGQ